MSWLAPRKAGERALVNVWRNELGGMMGAMEAHARTFMLTSGKRPPKRRSIAHVRHRMDKLIAKGRERRFRRAVAVHEKRVRTAKPARGY